MSSSANNSLLLYPLAKRKRSQEVRTNIARHEIKRARVRAPRTTSATRELRQQTNINDKYETKKQQPFSASVIRPYICSGRVCFRLRIRMSGKKRVTSISHKPAERYSALERHSKEKEERAVEHANQNRHKRKKDKREGKWREKGEREGGEIQAIRRLGLRPSHPGLINDSSLGPAAPVCRSS